MKKALVRNSVLGLQWEKTFTDSLPGDKVTENYVRQVKSACYSFVRPQTFPAPSQFILSASVCQLLGIGPELAAQEDFLKVFAGQKSAEGVEPWSCCYAGHQFGNWAGQLGDGRAITIGELRSPGGRLFDVQLKGSGKTPYSRFADGKAVLRSCIREYLASEAMAHLGVPTTRALGVFGTGERVVRDILYDGNPAPEPGALLCRVSESLIRFGSFELFHWQKNPTILRQLLDYSIRRNFGTLAEEPEPARYLGWLARVVESTARLVAKWQAVGFVHGVLNTDNMSVLGETIDFGPFGFMEEFEPGWTPNTTDNDSRRYTYRNQPDIGLWNLAMLANALLPLLGEAAQVREVLGRYKPIYQEQYRAEFGRKLGLEKGTDADVERLTKELLALLELCKLDMAIFFRRFADFDATQAASPADRFETFFGTVSEAFYDSQAVRSHLGRWEAFLDDYAAVLAQVGVGQEARRKIMNAANPKYILRNWQMQECIKQAEEGRLEMLGELDRLVQRPFEEQPEMDKFFRRRPDWAKRLPGYSMLSCSS